MSTSEVRRAASPLQLRSSDIGVDISVVDVVRSEISLQQGLVVRGRVASDPRTNERYLDVNGKRVVADIPKDIPDGSELIGKVERRGDRTVLILSGLAPGASKSSTSGSKDALTELLQRIVPQNQVELLRRILSGASTSSTATSTTKNSPLPTQSALLSQVKSSRHAFDELLRASKPELHRASLHLAQALKEAMQPIPLPTASTSTTLARGTERLVESLREIVGKAASLPIIAHDVVAQFIKGHVASLSEASMRDNLKRISESDSLALLHHAVKRALNVPYDSGNDADRVLRAQLSLLDKGIDTLLSEKPSQLETRGFLAQQLTLLEPTLETNSPPLTPSLKAAAQRVRESLAQILSTPLDEGITERREALTAYLVSLGGLSSRAQSDKDRAFLKFTRELGDQLASFGNDTPSFSPKPALLERALMARSLALLDERFLDDRPHPHTPLRPELATAARSVAAQLRGMLGEVQGNDSRISPSTSLADAIRELRSLLAHRGEYTSTVALLESLEELAMTSPTRGDFTKALGALIGALAMESPELLGTMLPDSEQDLVILRRITLLTQSTTHTPRTDFERALGDLTTELSRLLSSPEDVSRRLTHVLNVVDEWMGRTDSKLSEIGLRVRHLLEATTTSERPTPQIAKALAETLEFLARASPRDGTVETSDSPSRLLQAQVMFQEAIATKAFQPGSSSVTLGLAKQHLEQIVLRLLAGEEPLPGDTSRELIALKMLLTGREGEDMTTHRRNAPHSAGQARYLRDTVNRLSPEITSNEISQLRKVEQMIQGQEMLDRLNPVMKALGEPVFLLFPMLLPGLLAKTECSILDRWSPEENRKGTDKERSGAPGLFTRIRLMTDLPHSGRVGVDMSYRPKEIILDLSFESPALRELAEERSPRLEAVLRAHGYDKVEVRTIAEAPASVRPPWVEQIVGDAAIIA